MLSEDTLSRLALQWSVMKDASRIVFHQPADRSSAKVALAIKKYDRVSHNDHLRRKRARSLCETFFPPAKADQVQDASTNALKVARCTYPVRVALKKIVKMDANQRQKLVQHLLVRSMQREIKPNFRYERILFSCNRKPS